MKKILLISLAFFTALFLAPLAMSDEPVEKQFVKKRYKISGTAKLETIGNETHLTLSDDFKTKNGPDLKVFLTTKPIEELSGEDVILNGLKIGVLKSRKGGQSYIIPADVNLSDYESIVIHCEAYTVLWGGFDL